MSAGMAADVWHCRGGALMSMLKCTQDRQIERHCIAPKKPQRNGHIENFNGRSAAIHQADVSSTTPLTRMAHPTKRQGPTFSRRTNMPITAPTIIDISRIGATTLNGAPIFSAVSTRM